MKVLVTGASGFVGTALCAELCRGGHAVNGAFRLPMTQALYCAPFVVGSLGGEIDWSAALAEVDVVVHLAARVHVMQETIANPVAMFDSVNNVATRKLLQAAARMGVRRFIFLSTIKVNGESTAIGSPFMESGTPAPQDAYAWSKYHAEEGLKELATEYGLEWLIIRSPLVYGPSAKANFAALMRAVRRGVPLPLACIQNKRSLVSIDNLIDFILTCTTHPAAANQTFFVSDGDDLSTPDLVRAMALAAGTPARLFPVPVALLKVLARAVGEQAAVERLCGSLQVDIGKARNILQWSPSVAVHTALRRTFAGAQV